MVGILERQFMLNQNMRYRWWK